MEKLTKTNTLLISMKKLNWAIAVTFLTAALTFAQEEKKQQDIKSIKDMCGCYDITFKYTETFAPEVDYEQHHDYTAYGRELAILVEENENKVSLQHLLVLHDTMVIKHWRQDWLYENQKIFHYDKDNNWVFSTLPKDQVKGQWAQLVYSIDDSPRYAGSATWVHADGRNYWENKSDSPLPRREYSKRSDYNVLKRGNRHEITDYGWVHEQDNDKVIREEGSKDVLLVEEKGYNIYMKVDDKLCEAAAKWWAEHGEFWAKARGAWDEVFKREGDLTIKDQVADKSLSSKFYELEKENVGKNEILKVIKEYIDDKTGNQSAGK